MLETNRNSSARENYKETIAELSAEKKRLEFRLQLLKTENAGPGRLSNYLGVIFFILTIFGLLLFLFPDLITEMSSYGPYFLVIFSVGLLFIIYFRIKKENNTLINKIANRICEIEREIEEKKVFKSNSDQISIPPDI